MRKVIVIGYLLIALILGGLMSGCSTSFDNSPFPDPYIYGEGDQEIVFIDLPAACTIEIKTMSGDLIKTILENDGDGQASWDVTNEDGEKVGSGIYLYVIKSAEEERSGKIMITK